MTKTIAIGAGHGLHTAGKRTPNDEREWFFNSIVVESAIAHLKRQGFSIIRLDDATGKTDVPLATRAKKGQNADIYVSVHCNALAGKWGNHTGTETYFYPKGVQSKKLATFLHGEMLKITKLRDRGLKSNQLYETYSTKPPAALLEIGFMDSTIDIKVLRDTNKLKEIGKSIAKGICLYFGMTFKDELSTSKNEQKGGKIEISTTKQSVYRLIVQNEQIGAYSNIDNLLEIARIHLEKGVGNIRIEKK